MVKWGKSSEGFVYSKCGKFTISPEYWGCTRVQSYSLQVSGYKNPYRNFKTQSDAKSKAFLLTL